ncbi:MAG: EAL domain-containing protein [Fibrobacterales bacterium]|nr:EAL domain-containing protein [Fibrobacterales bacterium]
MNKNEKYQIRLLALVLAGLLAASVVFLIGTYRSALDQQQRSVLDQMQLVGAFVADNVDLESFRTVADAWSTGKGVSSPAAQKARKRLVGQISKAGRAVEGRSVRLMTRRTLSTYDERQFVDLCMNPSDSASRVQVPKTLWDGYASTKATQIRATDADPTISVFVPVTDASNRVIGHVRIAQDFRAQIRAERIDLLRSAALYLVGLVALLVFVFRHFVSIIALHVTERKQTLEQKIHIAEHDALTGLYNRSYVMDQIGQELKASRNGNGAFAVMMLDLDNFERVNELHGPRVGDDLLKLVGRRIHNILSKGDIVGRASGDEFIILLRGVQNAQFATTVAERVLKVVGSHFLVQEQELEVTVSIGICFYPEDGSDVGTLMRSAAAALSQAKLLGKNGYQLYNGQVSRRAVDLVRLEKQLAQARKNDELRLYYQPKFDLKKKLTGMEALIRWETKEGLVPPVRFIPVAENSGLIVEIGKWVIEEAARQLAEWNKMGWTKLRMAINVSPIQFNDDSLVPTLKKALDDNGVKPSDFEVEITESAMMQNMERTVQDIRRISELGIKIAIDDFGTGYSSLAKLAEIPIDTLKIDKSFVDNVITNEASTITTNSIIGLAKSLKKCVVAEVVENEDQLEYLAANGCDIIQGFIFGKPLPADDFYDAYMKKR